MSVTGEAIPASDVSVTSGSIALKILGKSGNFQITNGNKFILFTLDRLQEVDAAGKRIQFVNPHVFNSALSWGPVTPNVKIPGSDVSATMIKLNAAFGLEKPVGKKPNTTASTTITFILTVYIAQGTGTYTFADSTFPIKANDVKYTIEVSNWPFANSSNMLQFGLAMRTNTTDSSGGNTIKSQAELKTASLAVGKVVVKSPLVAIIDDNVSNKILSSTYGNGSGIQLSFPSFAKSLVYDPVVDTSGSTDTSTYTVPTTDSSGQTVLGGDTTLVAPDTTNLPVKAGQLFGISYIWYVIAVVLLIFLVWTRRSGRK